METLSYTLLWDFVLGIPNTFLSIFLAAILALIYLLFFVKDKTKPIGFGPFIAIAAYLLLLLWNKSFKLGIFIYLSNKKTWEFPTSFY